jgi:hypothetical protein
VTIERAHRQGKTGTEMEKLKEAFLQDFFAKESENSPLNRGDYGIKVAGLI